MNWTLLAGSSWGGPAAINANVYEVDPASCYYLCKFTKLTANRRPQSSRLSMLHSFLPIHAILLSIYFVKKKTKNYYFSLLILE